MKIKQALAGIAASLAFGAFAIAADFGSAPSDYEALTVEYFGERLTDPRSARYDFVGEPYQVFADLRGYQGVPCWAVDVRVKAKMPNGDLGGYVPYTVLFLDGEAIALEADVIRMVKA
ncbi:hypothetical protein [Hyphococcus sp.]|jgi:hypothetical protein|uniref:hypothetical protein n=1 Tax=Hyphococcus sp. TaxID=2038636 RepID=UPI003D11F277